MAAVYVFCVPCLHRREVEKQIEKLSFQLNTLLFPVFMMGMENPGNRYIDKHQVPLINKEETKNLHTQDFNDFLFDSYLVLTRVQIA